MGRKQAEKIYARMKVTEDGWKPGDFKTLFEGFGFDAHEGGSHTIYQHPQYNELAATVARHNQLAKKATRRMR